MHIFNVVDAMYISRLGTQALAALGFTIPFSMTLMGFIFGISVSTSSLLSRAFGEGDFEKVRRLATDALTLTAVIVATVMITGYFIMDEVFRRMGASESLLSIIHDYMVIWFFAYFIVSFVMISNAAVRGMGNTRYAAMIILIFVGVNLILDPILIFGWGPIPAFGFKGSAMTQAIGYTVSLITSFYFLTMRQKVLGVSIFTPVLFHSWKKLLHVGIPATISNLVPPVSAAIITWIISAHGQEAVAAIGVATRIEGAASMSFYALGGGLAIFAGQNFGAGNYGRIREAMSVALRYSVIFGFLMAGVLYYFGAPIANYFDKDKAVAAYVTQYLHIVPAGYAFLGVIVFIQAALNAMGKPLPATLLIILRMFALYVPMAFFAEKYFGFSGVLYALLATNIIVAVISWVWGRRLTF